MPDVYITQIQRCYTEPQCIRRSKITDDFFLDHRLYDGIAVRMRECNLTTTDCRLDGRFQNGNGVSIQTRFF